MSVKPFEEQARSLFDELDADEAGMYGSMAEYEDVTRERIREHMAAVATRARVEVLSRNLTLDEHTSLRTWAFSSPRKWAGTAFTSGLIRDIASAIEPVLVEVDAAATERACKAVCHRCGLYPLRDDGMHELPNGWKGNCAASAIRSAAAGEVSR